MEHNIRPYLTSECSFSSAWDRLDYTKHSPAEMGYVKATFSHNRWRDSWASVHPMLHTRDRWMELFNVARALTKSFPTLTSLACFCSMNGEVKGDGYNLYYEGEEANYWIRVTPHSGDCNLYVHSIVEEEW